MMRTLLIVAACFAAVAPAAAQTPTTRPSGFALVELFTSEGCSSCPPAEHVANDLARRAAADGTPVYVIAFHVDYWDHLGWRDRFATRAYSDRQRAYARAWDSPRIYTPQMVVNGRDEFVGSSARRAGASIERARKQTPRGRLHVSDAGGAGSSRVKATVRYDTDRDRAHLVLHAVLVEDGLVTKVERGENRGRTLHHDAVARGMTTAPLTKSATASIEIDAPADVDPARAALVTYVQDTRTMAIVAATRTPLAR